MAKKKANAKKAATAAITKTAKTTTAAATADTKEIKPADTIKETVKEATAKVAEKVAEKAPEVKETAKKAVEAVKDTVKDTAKAAKKSTKATKEKESVIVETFFEFDGNQVMAEELVERIKEAYKADGHRIGNIKTLRTYVNPAERRAYYVINDKAENKYIEF